MLGVLGSNHLIPDQIVLVLFWLRVWPLDLRKIPWRDYPLFGGVSNQLVGRKLLRVTDSGSSYCLGMSTSKGFDFALERIRSMVADVEDDAYLLEIAWLYNRIVLSGSTEPVIDLSYELVMPKEFVGLCVSTAMELGFIKLPTKGSNGGVISKKALRKLKQL